MSLKDIAQEMVEGGADKPARRSKHTVYVKDIQYLQFIEVCKRYNKTPSEIIDRLIESYLDEVRTILGDDAVPPPAAEKSKSRRG